MGRCMPKLKFVPRRYPEGLATHRGASGVRAVASDTPSWKFGNVLEVLLEGYQAAQHGDLTERRMTHANRPPVGEIADTPEIEGELIDRALTAEEPDADNAPGIEGHGLGTKKRGRDL
jgi:hypothetical protein